MAVCLPCGMAWLASGFQAHRQQARAPHTAAHMTAHTNALAGSPPWVTATARYRGTRSVSEGWASDHDRAVGSFVCRAAAAATRRGEADAGGAGGGGWPFRACGQ